MIKTKIKLNMINDVKEFLNESIKIQEDVDLVKGRYTVDAKSVIGVFTLDLSEPVEIVIHSDNDKLIEPFKKWEIN